MTDKEDAPGVSKQEVSVHIAARSHAEARAILEKALAMAAAGEHCEGKLVRGTPDGGLATFWTHKPRQAPINHGDLP